MKNVCELEKSYFDCLMSSEVASKALKKLGWAGVKHELDLHSWAMLSTLFKKDYKLIHVASNKDIIRSPEDIFSNLFFIKDEHNPPEMWYWSDQKKEPTLLNFTKSEVLLEIFKKEFELKESRILNEKDLKLILSSTDVSDILPEDNKDFKKLFYQFLNRIAYEMVSKDAETISYMEFEKIFQEEFLKVFTIQDRNIELSMIKKTLMDRVLCDEKNDSKFLTRSGDEIRFSHDYYRYFLYGNDLSWTNHKAPIPFIALFFCPSPYVLKNRFIELLTEKLEEIPAGNLTQGNANIIENFLILSNLFFYKGFNKIFVDILQKYHAKFGDAFIQMTAKCLDYNRLKKIEKHGVFKQWQASLNDESYCQKMLINSTSNSAEMFLYFIEKRIGNFQENLEEIQSHIKKQGQDLILMRQTLGVLQEQKDTNYKNAPQWLSEAKKSLEIINVDYWQKPYQSSLKQLLEIENISEFLDHGLKLLKKLEKKLANNEYVTKKDILIKKKIHLKEVKKSIQENSNQNFLKCIEPLETFTSEPSKKYKEQKSKFHIREEVDTEDFGYKIIVGNPQKALMHALKTSDKKLLEEILNTNGDMSQILFDNQLLVTYAKDVSIIYLLLDNIQQHKIDYQVWYERLLSNALEANNVQIMLILLLQKYVNPSKGDFLLKLFSKSIDPQILDALCKTNADYNQTNTVGQNCLHLACMRGDIKVIHFLLKYETCSLNAADNYRAYPLDYYYQFRKENQLTGMDEISDFILKNNLYSNRIEVLSQLAFHQKLHALKKVAAKLSSEIIDRCLLKYSHLLELNKESVDPEVLSYLLDKGLRSSSDFLLSDGVLHMLTRQNFNIEHYDFFNKHEISSVTRGLFLIRCLVNNQVHNPHQFSRVKDFLLKNWEDWIYIKNHKESFLSKPLKNDFNEIWQKLNKKERNYIIELIEIIEKEIKSLKNDFDQLQLNFQNILQRDKFYQPTPNVEKKKIIYVQCGHSKHVQHRLSLNIMDKFMFELQNIEHLKQHIDVQIYSGQQWLAEKTQEDAWIIIFSGEMHDNKSLNFGQGHFFDNNPGLSYEGILAQLKPEEHTRLACIMINAFDAPTFHVEEKKDKSFKPAWVVVNRFSNYTDDTLYHEHRACVKFMLDALFQLIYKNQSLREALIGRQNIFNYSQQIQVQETFCYGSRTVERRSEIKELVQNKKGEKKFGTFINRVIDKPLYRNLIYFNLRPRAFAFKSEEYLKLFNLIAAPPLKNALGFYNATPYQHTLKESLNVCEKIDKSYLPWILVFNLRVKEQKVVLQEDTWTTYENIKQKNELIYGDVVNAGTSISYVDIFFLLDQYIKAFGKRPTAIIVFQEPEPRDVNIVKPSNRNTSRFTTDYINGYHLMGKLRSEIMIFNTQAVTTEERTEFLEDFFQKLGKGHSIETAFHAYRKESIEKMTKEREIEIKLNREQKSRSRVFEERVFKMQLLCEPIELRLEKSIQPRYLFEPKQPDYVRWQKALIRSTDMVDTEFLTLWRDSLMNEGYSGINIEIENRNLLISALMRDLFDVARVLLTFKDIDVQAIDKNTGNTALHIACAKNKVDIVKTLLSKNANVNVLNFKMQSPMAYVYKFQRHTQGIEALINLLFQYGAKLKKEKWSQGLGLDIREMWELRERNYCNWYDKLFEQFQQFPTSIDYFPAPLGLIVSSEIQWKEWAQKLKDKHILPSNPQAIKKILFIHANPKQSHLKGDPHLRYMEHDYKMVEKYLTSEEAQRFVQVQFVKNYKEMRKVMAEQTFWMVIFNGHAALDYLNFLDYNQENTDHIPYAKFFNAIRAMGKNTGDYPECIFLNGCNTANNNSRQAIVDNCDMINNVIYTTKAITDSTGSNGLTNFLFKLFQTECTVSNAFYQMVKDHPYAAGYYELISFPHRSLLSKDDFVEKPVIDPYRRDIPKFNGNRKHDWEIFPQYIELARQYLPKPNEPLKILYIAPYSRGLRVEQIDQPKPLNQQHYELQQLINYTNHKYVKRYIQLEICATHSELKQKLAEHSFWMIYFSGYTNQHNLYLHNESESFNHPVALREIFELIRATQKELKCLTLNTCSPNKPNWMTESLSLDNIADYVVTPCTTIGDFEAALFMHEFMYYLICRGNNIESAFENTVADELLKPLFEIQNRLGNEEEDSDENFLIKHKFLTTKKILTPFSLFQENKRKNKCLVVSKSIDPNNSIL